MTLPTSKMRKVGNFFKNVLLVMIRAYQLLLSPMLGPACRFHPSCSRYAFQAISRYGAGPGLLLSLKRILRCHPFSPGGIDPVP